MVDVFFNMTSTLNEYIGAIVTGIVILALLYVVIKYAYERLKEDGFLHGIYLSIIYALEFALAAWFFWKLPIILAQYITLNEFARWLRWGEIFLAGVLILKTRKHAETRGVYSFLVHYTLFLFGWLIDRWAGIMIITVPVLAIYYFVMSHVAFAVIPASNPDDKKEKQNRFKSFLSYVWGIQLPFWKTSSNTAKDAEKRIDGAPSFKLFSGLIWTHSHQVTGIVEGPKFSVGGPGLLFVSKSQQPFEVVDLRNQTRSSTIKAISRDGISFEANVSVTFVVDREPWTKDQHQELRRANTLLRDGMEPDKNLDGTFPYSHARVKSVLSYRSRKTMGDGEETERWDDHVLSMAEQAAREVLTERSIEDLWKARENENSSAAEEIANEMKDLINGPLRINGIQLINAKAANFSFKEGSINKKEEKEDEVTEQQLATWSIEWERQRSMTLANGQAESERLQQEARAYAHSILLTAIAEGLQQARAIHPNLPRYVIAMRFIGALEEMLEQQPKTDEKENQKARANIRNAKAHFISNSRRE